MLGHRLLPSGHLRLLGLVFLVEAALCLAQLLAAAVSVAGQLVAALVAELFVLGGVDLGGLFEDLLRELS